MKKLKPKEETRVKPFDIHETILTLIRQKTFTGYFLTGINKMAVRQPGFTAGVMFKDYKIYLAYSPEFMESLCAEDQLAVLEHEAYHIIHRHILLGKKYLEKGGHVTREVLNVAFDFAVNSYIKFKGDLGKKCIVPSLYGLPSEESHKYYLDVLLKKMEEIEKNEPSEEPSEDAGGGAGFPAPEQGEEEKEDKSGSEKTMEELMEEFDKMTPEERFDELAKGLLQRSKFQKLLDKVLKDIQHSWDTGEDNEPGSAQEEDLKKHILEQHIRQAERDCVRNRGNIPGSIKDILKRLRSKPLPWNEILKTLITSAINTSFTPAYNRENRWFGTYPGKKREVKANVVIAVDTSGSVSDTLLSEFWNEIDKIYDSIQMELDIIECDTIVQNTWKYRKGGKVKISGRGGTNFCPVFEHLKEKSIVPDLLVFFTDGEGGCPDRAPSKYPVAWVYPEEWHRKLPWGHHLIMRPSQND